MHGIVDEKTDVYAYGVLLLELITGRQALDSSQKSLVMWVSLFYRAFCLSIILNSILKTLILIDFVENNCDRQNLCYLVTTSKS